MSQAAIKIIVTKLTQTERGWTARVSLDGETVEVAREGGGGWMVRRGTRLNDVPAWLAAELQARLPASERKRRASVTRT